MKFAYKFSNLFGTVYRQGNTLFTPDGNTVISPVGNRVSVFDLVNSQSRTLPFETRSNIARLALSRDGVLLIAIDEQGYALLINLPKNVVAHHFNFGSAVADLQFSPDGQFFAVTNQRRVVLWRVPVLGKHFAPLARDRQLGGIAGNVTCMDWSDDSRFLAVGSRDNTVKIFAVARLEHYRPVTLTAHRDRVVGVFFARDSHDVFTVSHDGTALHWHAKQEEVEEPLAKVLPQFRQRKRARAAVVSERPEPPANEDADRSSSSESASESEPEPEGETVGEEDAVQPGEGAEKAKGKTVRYVKHKWWLSRDEKHYFMQNHAKVVCAAFHKRSGLLVVGFTNGVFGLYEMPDFNNIHSLSISRKRISTVSINSTGDWLAIGCARLGQLLVWEWRSESYVLKQQGHAYDMRVLAFSPDGQIIATGGDDAKVKLWNSTSGFCYVTFPEHTGAITGIAFAQSGLAVVTSSLDGTVRAFDTTRYRNFRTFTAPRPTQFSCLAIDMSGELVGAGAQDTFEICVWSMRTGNLLELLGGHEAPISSLMFSPISAVMVSGSWDKAVRVWDIFEHKESTEPIAFTSDVVAMAFRPDGLEFVISTLDAQLTFWNLLTSRAIGTIDCRMDIAGGRAVTDRMAAATSDKAKQFTSLCFSADSSFLLAGGASKYVCIYDVAQRLLLKRFAVSNNRSIDGTLRMLNSKDMTEAGPLDLLDDYSDSDIETRLDLHLPGVAKGDKSSRRTRPEIRTQCVKFSPSGRSWAAATTEGLLLYSLDDQFAFDPFELTLDITPETIVHAISAGEHAKSLVMAFRLNEPLLIQQAVEAVAPADVLVVVEAFPALYVPRLLMFLSKQLETTRHLEVYLEWLSATLTHHGPAIKTNAKAHAVSLRAVQKALGVQHETLGRLGSDNVYALKFLLHRAAQEAASTSLGRLEDDASAAEALTA